MDTATYPDPLVSLVAFALGAALVAIVLWPGVGVIARLRKLLESNERIRLEDALKHIYVREHMGRPASLESVAGVLGAGRMVAARTVQHLSERGLSVLDGETPTLSEGGREYAARILRVHRLWERYLADRTGMDPSLWHDAAELAEHRLSADEAEALSSSLGHPLYDPHGDPIPTRAGDLPPQRGAPLSGMKAGDEVEIIHVEDEPPEIFAELNQLGFTPHVRLRVLSTTPERVELDLRDEKVQLGAIVAANVTVRKLEAGETVPTGTATLAEHSRQGETVVVTGISPSCQGPQRRRLLDLGVVPGTEITAELVSTGGDPVAYRIRGALIALRRDQARWIEVEPPPAKPNARRSA